MVDFRAVAVLAALAICGSFGQDSIKLGDLLTRLVTPDKELLGGFQTVVDRIYKFDGKHLACGQRGLCHAMSLTSVTRRDGTTGVEAGILRQAVDGLGNVLFNLARPLMEVIGLGAVAREEVSFTNFLINMADSVIIEVTRVLAGRRVSRQFEEFSPVLTLVDPAVRIVSSIPKAYIGNMVDFVVDVTNIADRRRGTYNLVRTAGMGYAFGGDPDDPVCSRLDQDDESACGDADGAFYPLTSLNAINDNHLGEIIRPTQDNPLLNRNHLATDVMKYNAFELSDIVNPKRLLCKTSNLLGSMQTHVDVVEQGTEPNFYYLDDVDLAYDDSSVESEAYDYTAEDNDEFNVKSDSGEEELDENEKMALKVFKKVKKIEQEEKKMAAAQLESNRRQIKKKPTNVDHFQDYCNQENKEAKRRFMKKMKEEELEASVTEVEHEDQEEETVVEASEDEEEIDEVDPIDNSIVNVKSGDSQLNNLEQLARLGDKSLLLERLEVEEGKEKKVAVEEYVASLNVAADGKVEKVVDVETKKKMLLVQFDSMTFRDAVLKASRSPGARSSSRARLRKPKVKDLKHVETLRH